ncbi:hypothetical protein C1645_841818 [Glomus cerebriforme]|uniref:Uncharacterized protein n=1 Tax=Glomus cerebriforme TaxID=658196 RepID=A0A397S2P3_9GLOM|nr:hypothetical protein C1645_841818 [Glomus cerebriforme]
MKYDIYFNNDCVNNTISATLEKLENTFFIENSSSEKIAFINKNFENLHLSNFEFAKNSDNYIKDSIYNDLKLKVKKVFKNKKCLYHSNCFEKIGYKKFFTHKAEFENLKKFN